MHIFARQYGTNALPLCGKRQPYTWPNSTEALHLSYTAIHSYTRAPAIHLPYTRAYSTEALGEHLRYPRAYSTEALHLCGEYLPYTCAYSTEALHLCVEHLPDTRAYSTEAL